MTGGGGRTWTYNLTTAGTATVLGSFTNPDGKTTSYTYDASSSAPARLNKVTDARTNDLLFQYGLGNDGGRVTQITRVVDGTTANDVVTKLAYNPASTVGHACATSGVVSRTVETDPENHATTYCVNNKGQVVETWDAKDRKTTTEYTPGANVFKFTDLAGSGNPSLTTFTWDDSTGNFQGAKTDVGARAQQTTVNYCADAGQPACGTAANAPYQPTKHTDSQGLVTTYGYNATGDLTDVQTGSATGDHQQLGYDSAGNVTSATDGRGNQTTFEYTANFLTKVVQPVPLAPRTYTPDSISRIATASSGNGSTATLTYDGEDRVTQIAFDNGGATFTFTYDANGNVTQRSDDLGNTTTYTYDKLNRRTGEDFTAVSNWNAYAYDKAGNLKSHEDRDGTTAYAYDEINRVSSITFPKPGGGTNAITFDYLDPPASGDPSTTTATYPGGLKRRTTTDSAGNVLSVKILNSGGTVLKKRDYSHDRSSTATSAKIQTMTDESGNVTTYTYGGPGRLTAANTVNGSTSVEQWAYEFDAAGNRTKRTHTVGTGTPNVTSYAYNQANQMCWSVAGATTSACSCVAGTPPTCSSAPAGSTAYTYGRSGDRTSGMTWDAGNRLWKIGTTNVYNLAPVHNGETIGYGTSAFTNNLLGVSRIKSGTSTATDLIRTPQGQLVAQRVGTTSKQATFTDALGSTIALADDGANALSRSYSYDPDGNASSSGSGATTDIQFAGGHKIASYYHFGARYYDPATATWTQLDPLNQISSLTEANRYAYVGGDPVNYVDPTGRDIIDDINDTVDSAETLVQQGIEDLNEELYCVGAEVTLTAAGAAAGSAAGPAGAAGGAALGAAGGAALCGALVTSNYVRG